MMKISNMLSFKILDCESEVDGLCRVDDRS